MDVAVEIERLHNPKAINKCDACGKFCSWESLYEVEYCTMDIAGGIDQSWAMECNECR